MTKYTGTGKVIQETMNVCSGIPNVTEDDIQLPYEEKLEIFKKDAETLYEFALTKGLSANQIRACLSPILGAKKSLGKRVAADSSRSLITLSFVIGVCAVLWGTPAIQNMIVIHARLLSVKTIPFWDWTPIYFEDCLFNNPFVQPEKNYTEEDCIACLEFDQIDRLKKIDMKVITEEYLYADFPFVVVNAYKNWPKEPNGELLFSLHRLNELLQEHPLLTEAATDCEFISTMDPVQNMSQFVKAFGAQQLPDKFHVAWENCDASAAKVFRMLASRPFFIPPFAEAAPHNQVIMANGNFKEEEFVLPQQVESATWLIVINGHMKITLVPHADCFQFKCKKSSFYLGQGEAVVVPSRIWNVTYAPTSKSYTLGYSTTIVWDDAA